MIAITAIRTVMSVQPGISSAAAIRAATILDAQTAITSTAISMWEGFMLAKSFGVRTAMSNGELTQTTMISGKVSVILTGPSIATIQYIFFRSPLNIATRQGYCTCFLDKKST